MITEDYVSVDVAKLLKDKGMNKKVFNYYAPQHNDDGTSSAVTVCTHQMAMKWLREVHNLHIWFGHSVGKGLSWYYEIHGISNGKVKHIGGIQYGSYEVACEAALKYALENLI